MRGGATVIVVGEEADDELDGTREKVIFTCHKKLNRKICLSMDSNIHDIGIKKKVHILQRNHEGSVRI